MQGLRTCFKKLILISFRFLFQCGLRQLDLSLLSQLWSLNESIQDFRQLLQEQEDGALSPPSPSASPSPSSDGDDIDDFYSPPPAIRFRPAPPPPPLRKTSNSSSATSSEYGTV